MTIGSGYLLFFVCLLLFMWFYLRDFVEGFGGVLWGGLFWGGGGFVCFMRQCSNTIVLVANLQNPTKWDSLLRQMVCKSRTTPACSKDGRKCFISFNTFYIRLYGVEYLLKGHSDNQYWEYYFRLAARDILYAPSHRQDRTYHGLCYTRTG